MNSQGYGMKVSARVADIGRRYVFHLSANPIEGYVCQLFGVGEWATAAREYPY
jgi:hypothetical protein